MANSIFIKADELAKELDISQGLAYKMIAQWNEELKAKGYTTVGGRVYIFVNHISFSINYLCILRFFIDLCTIQTYNKRYKKERKQYKNTILEGTL